MDINELYDWLMNVDQYLDNKQKQIAVEILKEIRTRLKFLLDVGLDYLALDRGSVTLSGGESQRIRLATQIGSQLVNVLYILDEPSIGLHQRDNQRLIHSLKELRDIGNSVIVVEHDKDMMMAADYVIDMGPKAGRLGGEVVFAGTPKEMLETHTLTSQYLNGERVVESLYHICSDKSGGDSVDSHIFACYLLSQCFRGGYDGSLCCGIVGLSRHSFDTAYACHIDDTSELTGQHGLQQGLCYIVKTIETNAEYTMPVVFTDRIFLFSCLKKESKPGEFFIRKFNEVSCLKKLLFFPFSGRNRSFFISRFLYL